MAIGDADLGSSHLELVEVVGHLPHASNTTVLARAASDSLWVYKPASGEQPLWDFPWQTLAWREVLAYEISEALGLGIVPETRVATGPLGPGSAQRFLDEDDSFDPRPLFQPRLDARLWPVAVFDIITNNADRKIGHLLIERGSGQLWAIDHGLTFHVQPKLRTVLWGFAGDPVPAELIASLASLQTVLDGGLASRIAELLSPAEAAAVTRRAQDLAADPRHPLPPDDRPPVPWPVW